jgi:hypothetical protein
MHVSMRCAMHNDAKIFLTEKSELSLLHENPVSRSPSNKNGQRRSITLEKVDSLNGS